MDLFIPDKAYIDPRALKYRETDLIIKKLRDFNVPVVNSRVVKLHGDTPISLYNESKKTLFITLNTKKKLPVCRPSADYQFALTSSCPGMCEYCYLQTTQGEKPIIKVFANIGEIFDVIEEHINVNLPNITTFECASITDPVALEHLTSSLRECIEFFSEKSNGRLRIVTKFDNVEPFLNIKHMDHTKFRFSINSKFVINSFEHKTPSLEKRIDAAKKIAASNYPIGFILAPIMIYDGWKDEYKQLLERLGTAMGDYRREISFELIQHRFTNKAKELILSRFPNTSLDMDEEKRILKWGPYGQFKYVYKKNDSSDIKEYIENLILSNFKNCKIEYFT